MEIIYIYYFSARLMSRWNAMDKKYWVFRLVLSEQFKKKKKNGREST